MKRRNCSISPGKQAVIQELLWKSGGFFRVARRGISVQDGREGVGCRT